MEESQSALLSQVKEMDHSVDVARGEVRNLSQDCTILRKEVIRVREELGIIPPLNSSVDGQT